MLLVFLHGCLGFLLFLVIAMLCLVSISHLIGLEGCVIHTSQNDLQCLKWDVKSCLTL